MDISNDLASLQPTDLDAGQVFSGKPSGTAIRGYATSSAYTPAIDSGYVFHESSRDMVVWFLSLREPLYVFGPSGCGKTSCIKQLAARLNYPVFEVAGHGRLEFADLIGTSRYATATWLSNMAHLHLPCGMGGFFSQTK